MFLKECLSKYVNLLIMYDLSEHNIRQVVYTEGKIELMFVVLNILWTNEK